MNRLAALLAALLAAGSGAAQPDPPPVYMTGAKPSAPQVLASAPRFLPDGKVGAPTQFARIPDRIHIWGNNRNGCCVTSEEAAAKIAAHPHVWITEREVIAWASRNRVLNGATLSEVLEEMCSRGLLAEDGTRYQNGRPLLVDFRDRATLCDAIHKGPVKIAVASGPLINSLNQNQGKTGWAGVGYRRDDRTDHCTGYLGYGPASFLYAELAKKYPEARMPASLRGDEFGLLMFTWGTIGFVDWTSHLAICREAWYRNPTTEGFPEPEPTPEPDPQPGPRPGPPAVCPVPRWLVMLVTAGALLALAVGLPAALRSIARGFPKAAAVVLAAVALGASACAGPVPCEAQAGKSHGECVVIGAPSGEYSRVGPQTGNEVAPPSRPERYDPYRFDSYAEMRDTCSRPGGWGVLYVGVPDESVGTYAPHLWMPSGFKGLADGVYDCKYDGKQPVMKLRNALAGPVGWGHPSPPACVGPV